MPRHLVFLETIVTGNRRRFVSERPAGVTRAAFIAHLFRIVVAYLKVELTSARCASLKSDSEFSLEPDQVMTARLSDRH